MRDVSMGMHMSADGYVATRDGSLDWAFPRFDEELEELAVEALSELGIVLLGRVNYEEQASHWPNADGSVAEIMNTVDKIVFSNTIDDQGRLEWENSRLAKGSPEEEIGLLRRDGGSGRIAVAGGATLVRHLTDQGLIDEFRFVVHPVALGEGLSIFSKPVSLDLVDSKRLLSGVVVNIYRRSG